MTDWISQIISFDGFAELLPVVRESLLAGLLLGVIAGLVGPMIRVRDLAFAVHGTAELSFAGAAAALLLGTSVTMGAVAGSLVAALIIALMGSRAHQRNSAIGIILPFGLGLGMLFLALYRGRSSNKFGLLAGQIVSVDAAQLTSLAIVALIIAAVLLPIWRPLFFASVDPEIARARGVPVRALGIVFMLVLGLACAMSVQIVGALLVMSLLIIPTAAASRVTARPAFIVALSVLFAVVSTIGGIVLSLSPGLPISPYVTTLSFLIYLGCALIGWLRSRAGWVRRTSPAPATG